MASAIYIDSFLFEQPQCLNNWINNMQYFYTTDQRENQCIKLYWLLNVNSYIHCYQFVHLIKRFHKFMCEDVRVCLCLCMHVCLPHASSYVYVLRFDGLSILLSQIVCKVQWWPGAIFYVNTECNTWLFQISIILWCQYVATYNQL